MTPQALADRCLSLKREFGGDVFTAHWSQPWREAHNGAEFARLLGAERVRSAAKDPPDIEIIVEGDIIPVEVVEAMRPGRRRDAEFRAEAFVLDALRNGTALVANPDRLDARDRFHLEVAALLWFRCQPQDRVAREAVRALEHARVPTPEQRAALAAFMQTPAGEDYGWWMTDDEVTGDGAALIRTALTSASSNKAAKGYPAEFWLLIYLNPGFAFDLPDDVMPLLHAGTEPARSAFAQVWVLWNGAAYQAWQDGQRGGRLLRAEASD